MKKKLDLDLLALYQDTQCSRCLKNVYFRVGALTDNADACYLGYDYVTKLLHVCPCESDSDPDSNPVLAKVRTIEEVI